MALSALHLFHFYVALLPGANHRQCLWSQGIFLATARAAIVCYFLCWWVVPIETHVAAKGDTLPVIKDIKVLLASAVNFVLDMSVLILHMLITLIVCAYAKVFW